MVMKAKQYAKTLKSLVEYIKIIGGKIMEITIDAHTYDKLKDYSQKMNEPMSVIATKAIKKYIDVSD